MSIWPWQRAVLLSVLTVLSTLVPAGSIRAQVEPWDCATAPPTTPQASPSTATPASAAEFPSQGGELTVFAAASLTDAFRAMAEAISDAHPNVEITFNFAGSQALVTQIVEGGAEPGVLALASPEQMTAAIEAGVPAASTEIFARNSLVVVVPRDNPAGIAAITDLDNDDLRLVVSNPDVPAGDYARQSLCIVAASLAADDPEFLANVAGNVVSEEENVRAVLTKVELGEADAGIVYISDAMSAGDAVTVIEIPAEQNVSAEYPIAALTADPLAIAFVDYVLSAEGQATLASFGFAPIG